MSDEFSDMHQPSDDPDELTLDFTLLYIDYRFNRHQMDPTFICQMTILASRRFCPIGRHGSPHLFYTYSYIYCLVHVFVFAEESHYLPLQLHSSDLTCAHTHSSEIKVFKLDEIPYVGNWKSKHFLPGKYLLLIFLFNFFSWDIFPLLRSLW